MVNDLIYDRGRGPELRRTRFTVYDLIPYLEGGCTDAQILEWVSITAEELAALKQYIADHHDEVMAKHRQIEERIRREMEARYTPEYLAEAEASRKRLLQFRDWLNDRRREGTLPPPGTGWAAFREWLAASEQAAAEHRS